MFGFLKRLFGGAPQSFKFEPEVTGGEEDLVTFVKYVVCSLVDTPEKVVVDSKSTEKHLNIKVNCEKEDIGKVIGKSGKTIEAIRSLVNGAAGRLGKRASVEVVD